MEKQLILNIISYAIRAPSTHNSQPWLFRLQANSVSVFYDEKLKLPQADNDGRDLYVSIGCMLENMRIAAAHFGFSSTVTFSINEVTHHIAEVVFIKNSISISSRDEKLFETIPIRVNARGVFISDKVPNNSQESVLSIVDEFKSENISVKLMIEKSNINQIAEITQEAMHEAYSNPAFRAEMSSWMNSNISLKKQGLPGYSLKMPLIVSLIIPFLIRYLNMGKFLGKLNLKSLSSAPMIVILSSPNKKESWISIGQCAERIMLYLQSQKLQTSIYVGSIEMGELYKKVQKLTGGTDRPQFVFAVGKIPGIHRITPRHNLHAKLI
jgi:hypothetical protein